MRWNQHIPPARVPLPRSLAPLPGEALPGYVLRLAHRLGRSPQRLAELTGLADSPAAHMLGSQILTLDPTTSARFAAVTKLSLA